jgi:hypothetical protein
MALPNRLVIQGFPCHRLYEQRRMHKAISRFPGRTMYNGLLRDGPGMDISLQDQIPGLRQVLVDIIAGELAASPVAQKAFINTVTDDNLRRHYVEVIGTREAYEGSSAVMEHIKVFMEKIFPKLFKFYRASDKDMREEVMIICAYNYAVSETCLAIRPNAFRH